MSFYRPHIYLMIGLMALLISCRSPGVEIRQNQDEQTTSRFSEADEALYLKRFANLMEAFKTTGRPAPYDNLEPVSGADDYTPLPRSLAASASILKAREYAATNNSLAFIIWHNGKIIEETYFQGSSPESPVTSLSLAKPLSVIGVGRAIQVGKIKSLDTSIAEYIHEWKDSDKSKIHLEHILRMSSGLLPQGLATREDDVLNRAYLHPRHDEVIFHEYPLVDEPGSRYEYSNANGELVAPVIERATGQRYGDWISNEVLKPIGAMGGEVWVNRPGGTAHSGCCILLPAETYLRLAILLLNDGIWEGKRLLPEGFVKTMSTPSVTNKDVGMGLYIGKVYEERRGYANPETTPDKFKVYHSEPYIAGDLVLFDGNQNQVVYIVPSRNLIILRVGTRPKADPEWDNSYLPNTIIRGMQAE